MLPVCLIVNFSFLLFIAGLLITKYILLWEIIRSLFNLLKIPLQSILIYSKNISSGFFF